MATGITADMGRGLAVHQVSARLRVVLGRAMVGPPGQEALPVVLVVQPAMRVAVVDLPEAVQTV